MTQNINEELFNNFKQKFELIPSVKKVANEIMAAGYDLSSDAKNYDNEEAITKQQLLDMLSKPTPFKIDEFDQVYVELKDENGDIDKIFISEDDGSKDYNKISKAVIDTFPTISWSLNPEGSAKKKKETDSMFKIIILNQYLDGVFEEEIRKTASDYDWDNFVDAEGEPAFTNLLTKSSAGLGKIADTILMCCTSYLGSTKEKKDSSFVGILSKMDAESLRTIVNQIADLNFENNNWYKEHPAATKYQRAKNKKSYDDSKGKIVNALDPDMTILYSIYSQETNKVPDRIKNVIKAEAIKSVSEVLTDDILKFYPDADEFKKREEKKLSLRGRRTYLRYRKISSYIKYVKGVRDTNQLLLR